MIYMLCRNRVADYSRWKHVFDSHTAAHREAGLRLIEVWRTIDDPDEVFFLFAVEDIEKAKAFIDDPDSAAAGEAAGVVDGEYHFVEKAPGP